MLILLILLSIIGIFLFCKLCIYSIKKNAFKAFLAYVILAGIILSLLFKQNFSYVFSSFIALIFLIVSPIVVTIINTIFLVKKIYKYNFVNYTIFNASICVFLLLTLVYFDVHTVYEYKTVLFDLKNPLEYNKINYLLYITLGLISLYKLNNTKKGFSPIITVLMMSSIYLLNILTLFMAAQFIGLVSKEITFSIFFLVPYNSIVITIIVFRKVISQQLDEIHIENIHYKNNLLNKCYIILCNVNNWGSISFAIVILLFIVNIVFNILILFGQGGTSYLENLLDVNKLLTIKEVAISSPAPKDHYLCTVALQGDEKIVKPLRYGYRYDKKIIVNRQLLVANAFEDYIKVNLPNFHMLIRNFYDKYGYPLSNKITTKKAANITYVLMKPLEYFFVLFLYTFDHKPEARISRQYTYKNF